jgi:hypothetical protein
LLRSVKHYRPFEPIEESISWQAGIIALRLVPSQCSGYSSAWRRSEDFGFNQEWPAGKRRRRFFWYDQSPIYSRREIPLLCACAEIERRFFATAKHNKHHSHGYEMHGPATSHARKNLQNKTKPRSIIKGKQ